MPSLQLRRSSVVLVLLLVLMFPTMALAQKAKPQNRVPTPTGAFPAELIYGVTTTNALISFNSATPGSILSTVAITGLQAGRMYWELTFDR